MQFTIGERMWIINKNKFTENKATGIFKYVTGEGNNMKMLNVPRAIHAQIQDAFRRGALEEKYQDAGNKLS